MSSFFDDPFPALAESRRVHLETGEVSYHTYKDSLNPPILHRRPEPVRAPQPNKHLERGLQRDIKHFFGEYRAAQSAGFSLLMQIADAEAVEQTRWNAAENGLGWLERRGTELQPLAAGAPLPQGEGAPDRAKSLQLHVSMVKQLPSLLRVYVGHAAVLCGDYLLRDENLSRRIVPSPRGHAGLQDPTPASAYAGAAPRRDWTLVRREFGSHRMQQDGANGASNSAPEYRLVVWCKARIECTESSNDVGL